MGLVGCFSCRDALDIWLYLPCHHHARKQSRKEGEGMLDINLFREEKGQNPEIVRKSQRRRFANVENVDEIILADKELRQRQFALEQVLKALNRINKEVAKRKTAGEDVSYLIRKSEENKDSIAKKAVQVQEARAALYSKLELVGNLVHDSVPVSNDKANNVVVRTWGEKRTEQGLKTYGELVELLGIADLERGANVAGKGGAFFKDGGVDLNQALISFGLDFLEERGFEPLQPVLFMTKNIMEKCAQSAQFDEELYKVTGDGDDKYLIATAEQPLSAYHMDEWIQPTKLPLRYVGYSSCFRTEVTCGIFDLCQFEKVEQVCITSPRGNESWDMLEEMTKNTEELYQKLKLPYQRVSVVSGALSDAASKTYDLEAWFPASNTYKQLASCSNYTDYRSRKLEIRFGHKEGNEQTKRYCHLLNSTLTDTVRTMCCILENYQREDGVEVPQVLQPYMGGKDFMPFQELSN